MAKDCAKFMSSGQQVNVCSRLSYEGMAEHLGLAFLKDPGRALQLSSTDSRILHAVDSASMFLDLFYDQPLAGFCGLFIWRAYAHMGSDDQDELEKLQSIVEPYRQKLEALEAERNIEDERYTTHLHNQRSTGTELRLFYIGTAIHSLKAHLLTTRDDDFRRFNLTGPLSPTNLRQHLVNLLYSVGAYEEAQAEAFQVKERDNTNTTMHLFFIMVSLELHEGLDTHGPGPAMKAMKKLLGNLPPNVEVGNVKRSDGLLDVKNHTRRDLAAWMMMLQLKYSQVHPVGVEWYKYTQDLIPDPDGAHGMLQEALRQLFRINHEIRAIDRSLRGICRGSPRCILRGTPLFQPCKGVCLACRDRIIGEKIGNAINIPAVGFCSAACQAQVQHGSPCLFMFCQKSLSYHYSLLFGLSREAKPRQPYVVQPPTSLPLSTTGGSPHKSLLRSKNAPISGRRLLQWNWKRRETE